jgi:penicillin-binding protein 2
VTGLTDYTESRVEPMRRLSRFLVFGLAIVLALGGLTARLFYLQVVSGVEYSALAAQNRSVLQAIPAPRGLIFDRDGRPLVTNAAMLSVKVRAADIPEERRDEIVGRLADLLSIDVAEINEAIDSNPGSRFDLVRVAEDVDEATAGIISESRTELPGVEVVVEAVREYPEGPLVSQLLGYTGPVSPEEYEDLREDGYLSDDWLGKTGVEAQYERDLRGIYGLESVARSASGRRGDVLRTVREAQPGNSLTLTIDVDEQKKAEKALKWAMKAIGMKRGVVIAMNPQTGEVIAMVSLPTYDNNAFARGISNKDFAKLIKNKDKPLTNHAVQAHYPPGSTYKLVAGTGVLADKKITASTRVRTVPYLTIGGTRFWEWNRRGWGGCNIYCGFGHSSDTFFYQMATKLGADRLAYWGRQYGFGSPTGIDLPGEVSGIVPSNKWKQDTLGAPMFAGETAQAGIGQGYDVVTPIQLINAFAALANGGKLLQPQIVREIVGPDGEVVRPFKPILNHKVKASKSVLTTMRMAARETVTLRHTYNLVDLPIKVAGKSGTAEFGTRDSKGRLPYHSWFVGFVPKSPRTGSFTKPNSELIVLAFAYDSRTKGNAATEIVKYYLQLHYGIKKDYRNHDLVERGNFYQSN